jgi:hypothetical protein
MYAIHALRTFPHTDSNVYVLNHELGPWEIAGECDDVGVVEAEGFGAARVPSSVLSGRSAQTRSPMGKRQRMGSAVEMQLGSSRVSGKSNLKISPG